METMSHVEGVFAGLGEVMIYDEGYNIVRAEYYDEWIPVLEQLAAVGHYYAEVPKGE